MSEVVEFEGRNISLVTSVYADRVFVIVNELPSFGTLVRRTIIP